MLRLWARAHMYVVCFGEHLAKMKMEIDKISFTGLRGHVRWTKSVVNQEMYLSPTFVTFCLVCDIVCDVFEV